MLGGSIRVYVTTFVLLGTLVGLFNLTAKGNYALLDCDGRSYAGRDRQP